MKSERMLKATYLAVIVIWSTTPLAVQWSIQSGMLFGLMSRMSIGLFVLVMLFVVTKQKLSLHKDAFIAYLTVGLGIYFAMSFVYWSAQYIPSGWISVIFGLSPIMTGILSIFVLGENHFTISKTIGMVLGVAGLIVIFHTSAAIDMSVVHGVLAMVMSTFAHAMSAVLVKRINAPVSGTESTLGGLLIAVPLILVTFLLSGEKVGEFTAQSVVSMLYLGAIATAAGFSMYYYILNKLNAIKVSLITLVSPVCALLLGSLLNDESITISVLIGGGLILSGLALFEFLGKEAPSKINSANKLCSVSGKSS
ncbi:MAG: EamA family transporter [Pseudomonadota bacterium]